MPAQPCQDKFIYGVLRRDADEWFIVKAVTICVIGTKMKAGGGGVLYNIHIYLRGKKEEEGKAFRKKKEKRFWVDLLVSED